jgi:hypothetical protein
MHARIYLIALIITTSFFVAAMVSAQAPQILSTSPGQNELDVAVAADISITFDVDIDETTITGSSFVVNGKYSGLRQGTFSYDGGTKTATFHPSLEFEIGEEVTVVLTTEIESAEAVPMENSYIWSFTTAVANNSTGVFDFDAEYDINFRPDKACCADLDNDGDIDIAVVASHSYDVCILLNNGNGNFAEPMYHTCLIRTHDIVAADLNRDGLMDLAVTADIDSELSILINTGNALFADYLTFSVGSRPSVAAADFNGDGYPDLLTAHQYMDTISVLFNNGNGMFGSLNKYSAGRTPR